MSTRTPVEPLAKVLIIEDEKTLAEMIAAYLARSGYQTTVEHNGVAGVEAAREQSPDVVILDLGLPGLHRGLPPDPHLQRLLRHRRDRPIGRGGHPDRLVRGRR